MVILSFQSTFAPSANDSSGLNPWLVKWDTIEFDYQSEDYFLDQAYLTSSNGYIDGIDNDLIVIAQLTRIVPVALSSSNQRQP